MQTDQTDVDRVIAKAIDAHLAASVDRLYALIKPRLMADLAAEIRATKPTWPALAPPRLPGPV